MEPVQEWQALDLVCAVCQLNPCETPDVCTDRMTGDDRLTIDNLPSYLR